MSNKSTQKNEWYKTITYVVLFIVLLVAGGNFFLPLGGIGVLLWIILTVIGLFILISWHSKNSSYRCLECENIFSISFFRDFLSFQRSGRGGNKYLICQICRKRSRTKYVNRNKNSNYSE